jgi:hypothetical protein
MGVQEPACSGGRRIRRADENGDSIWQRPEPDGDGPRRLTIEVSVLTVRISPARRRCRRAHAYIGGTVNDPSVRESILLLNGTSRVVPVIYGRFTAAFLLADGNNIIVVTVPKTGDVNATDTLVLDPTSAK